MHGVVHGRMVMHIYMNFTVLKNIVAQPMNMFVLELMFLY